MAVNIKATDRLTIADMDTLAGTSMTTGAIDWSKITVASSTATTFKKTVFNERMVAEGRVSDYAVHAARDASEVLKQVKGRLEAQVRRTVAIETKCPTCPHMKVMVMQDHDFKSAERLIRVMASCGLDKPGHTSVICPDGQIVSRTGPVRTLSFEENTEIANSAPEFSTKNEEPYIRKDPDKPSSAGGDVAW